MDTMMICPNKECGHCWDITKQRHDIPHERQYDCNITCGCPACIEYTGPSEVLVSEASADKVCRTGSKTEASRTTFTNSNFGLESNESNARGLSNPSQYSGGKLYKLPEKETIRYCVSQFCYYWMVNDGKYHCSYKKPCMVKETFEATYNSAKEIDIDALAEYICHTMFQAIAHRYLDDDIIKVKIEEFIREL